jgi:hypothetical protein
MQCFKGVIPVSAIGRFNQDRSSYVIFENELIVNDEEVETAYD